MKIDQLIRSKRKTVALIVERDGRLLVRAPLRLALWRIQEFVDQKAEWIERQRARLQKQAEQPTATLPKHQYFSGETFWFLGTQKVLQVMPGFGGLEYQDESFYLGQQVRSRAKDLFTEWYRRQARVILTERVQEYARKNGFVYQKIRISSARTRWGSCSSRGTLSFTWRLVMAPLAMIDYVVVHELVHLRHPNHSTQFWVGVQKILPDYQWRRDWLKNNGGLLRID